VPIKDAHASLDKTIRWIEERKKEGRIGQELTKVCFFLLKVENAFEDMMCIKSFFSKEH
jgi:hypothetical protein